MRVRRLLNTAVLALLIGLWVSLPALAQTRTQETDYAAAITIAAEELRSVDAGLTDDLAEDEREQLRLRIAGARSSALEAIETMEEELELVAEREAQLGPKPEGATEAPDILAERQEITQRRGMLESAIKRGRLVAVEAQQLSSRLRANRAEQISNEVGTRFHSPVTPAFWVGFGESAHGDVARLGRLLATGNTGILAGLRQGGIWIALAGLIAAIILAFPVRALLRNAGQKYIVGATPPNRLRRSGYAVWRVMIETLMPSLAIAAFVHGLRWAGMINARWEPVAVALVDGVILSSFLTSLAGALLMRKQQSWRLLPVSDEVAGSLRMWTWLLAILSLIYALLAAISVAMTASAPALALMHIGMIGGQVVLFTGILMTLARMRMTARQTDNAPRHTLLALLTIAAWAVVLVGTVAMLAGYLAFSLFVFRLVSWLVIVWATLYLVWVFVDDLSTTVFCANSHIGQWLVNVLGTRGALIDQIGVVLSGGLRLLLVLLAISAVLFPFGTGFNSVFEQLGALARGITIGEMTLSPGAVARAIIVFVIGAALVRMFQGWLNKRYLPKTEWDAGARNSVSMIAGYAGLILVTLWSLASMGIGVERIALLLSALSVGIGFGLQAITQNFVSGLILLAERPVKIGDWIKIGNDEGDVKRVSVRATEIQLGDHSTLIVPNSELITKSVLNKTRSAPLGRVQIEFSTPIETDVAAVRATVDSVFADEPRVLTDPAPAVFIDRIADGRVMFNCFAHVASPRDAYSTRSALLIDLLQRFHAGNIDVGTVPQKLELLSLPPADPAAPQGG